MSRHDEDGDNAGLAPNDGLGDVQATYLVRVNDTVHARGCWHTRQAATVLPWNWAEGKPVWAIADAQENGLRFCLDCKPLNQCCNIQGPAGQCDLPPHAGDEHQWSVRNGASAFWRGDFAEYEGDPWEAGLEPADVDL